MAEINTGAELVAVSLAAEELASTRLKVLMLIKTKSLAGVMAAGEWCVTRESLDSLKAQGIPVVEGACRTACRGTCGCH